MANGHTSWDIISSIYKDATGCALDRHSSVQNCEWAAEMLLGFDWMVVAAYEIINYLKQLVIADSLEMVNGNSIGIEIIVSTNSLYKFCCVVLFFFIFRCFWFSSNVPLCWTCWKNVCSLPGKPFQRSLHWQPNDRLGKQDCYQEPHFRIHSSKWSCSMHTNIFNIFQRISINFTGERATTPERLHIGNPSGKGFLSNWLSVLVIENREALLKQPKNWGVGGESGSLRKS